jgi:hypothetical protein
MTSAVETTVDRGQANVTVRRRGCLIFSAVIVLGLSLSLLSALRIYHPRFKESLPSRIEVQAWQYSSSKGFRNYTSTISNPSECRAVMAAFKRGTWVMPHMCKGSARFEIHYENGSVDHVDFMLGHAGPNFCEIRTGLGHYRLSRKAFSQIMNDAGVDASEFLVD